MDGMPITPRQFGDRGRRRAISLGIDPERLPPGQSPTEKWPVLSVEDTPQIALADWTLTIDGAVEEPVRVDWKALMAEPQTDWKGDIHCVTRWSKFGMRWQGVDVARLIERARPKPSAGFMLAESVSGYTTDLPLSDLTEHTALVAHHADGEPLEPEHGGPVRLFVPHLYLWKSAKWLSRLQLLEEDELGFWERNGYHHRGDPWLEERRSVDEYVARAMRREARSAGLDILRRRR
jgi:DMSO/TMAO reductase YedYZ molybdopterin-dependent catalytic subunit